MRLEYKWQAAIVASLGLFMAVLDNTIVNVALPQMQAAFNTDRATITWVATGYFLAQAAVIPVTGYLSDLIGTKTCWIAALLLFTAGSGLCAISPSQGWLLFFRVVQGIGGGGLFPLAFAIVFRVFPPTERGPASAVVAVPVLLAPAFGPTIGGFLTTTFDWRAIVLINLPVGVVALAMTFVVLQGRSEEQAAMGASPESPRPKRFDVVGLILAMAGTTSAVYGISQAATYGWNTTPFNTLHVGGVSLEMSVVSFLVVGVVLLIAFVINELVVSDPVLDVRLFLNYTFTMANVLVWGVSAFLFGTLFLIPIFFENVQGQSALSTGEILLPAGVASAVTTALAGRLYNRVGPRLLTAAGFLLIAVGTHGFTQLEVTTTSTSLQPWLVLRGFGLGLANVPLQTLALSVVSNRDMARASSLSNATRQVFAAIGISALTTVFVQSTSTYAKQITAVFLHAQATHTAPSSGAAAACYHAVGANATLLKNCAVAHATTSGLNTTFTVTFIGCSICMVLALFLGRDPAVQAAKEAGRLGAPATQRPQVVIGE
ncbi:MAG: DHA2 family efflux MFS transporter permease subunit [Ktedonobacterales bacterium]